MGLHWPKKELDEEAGVDWSGVCRCDFFALLDTGAEQGHKHLRCTARVTTLAGHE